MIHDRAAALLIDLVYGELSGDDAREVERHVAGCSTCASELDRLRTTRRIAAMLTEEQAPVHGREALREAARRALAQAPPRAEGQAPPRAERWTRARAYAIAASAAVVVLVAGVTLRLSDRDAIPAAAHEHPDERPAAALTGRPPPSSEAERTTPSPRVDRSPAQVAPPPRVQPRPPERSPVTRGADSAVGGAEQAVPPSRADGAVASAEPAAPRSRAVAPKPATAGRSQQSEAPAARSFEAPGAPDVLDGEARSVVEDVERRAAAGQLRTDARRLVCGGAVFDRIALLEGAHVVKLTVRDAGGTLLEGWYDAAGRLSAFRRAGAELVIPRGEGPGESSTRPGELPARAPPVEELPRCEW